MLDAFIWDINLMCFFICSISLGKRILHKPQLIIFPLSLRYFRCSLNLFGSRSNTFLLAEFSTDLIILCLTSFESEKNEIFYTFFKQKKVKLPEDGLESESVFSVRTVGLMGFSFSLISFCRAATPYIWT